MLVLYVKGCFKRKRLQQYCLCVPKRGVCNDDTYVLCSSLMCQLLKHVNQMLHSFLLTFSKLKYTLFPIEINSCPLTFF